MRIRASTLAIITTVAALWAVVNFGIGDAWLINLWLKIVYSTSSNDVIPLVMAVAFLLWIPRVISSLRADPGPGWVAERIPTCITCGYALPFVPTGGRCPECGNDAIASRLNSGRFPSDWERKPCWSSFLATTEEVLFHPIEFYRRTRHLDREPVARAFARRHYIAMSLSAGASVAALDIARNPPGQVDWGVAVFVMFMFPILGWCLKRLAAFVSGLMWVHASLSAAILAFETPCLWPVLAYNVAVVSDAVLTRSWLAGLLLHPLDDWIGLATFPAALFIGNVVALGVWIIRLRIAGRCTRWSNH